jgi:alkyl sulfatase BDS1-like metallo-beta-lactamase superfamily hydrolase
MYHGDRRVGTYVSSTRGFSTSSYWIEGRDGLILIDTQFPPSAAEEFLDWAERTTGKRARLAIVLHANPDRFNGTAVLNRRGLPVVTSAQVRALIPGIRPSCALGGPGRGQLNSAELRPWRRCHVLVKSRATSPGERS